MMLDEGYNINGALLGGMEMEMVGTILHLVELKVWIILGQNGDGLIATGCKIWRQ